MVARYRICWCAHICYDKGWLRFEWLPSQTDGSSSLSPAEGWQRAWHGTKLEALFSIMYFGDCWKAVRQSKVNGFASGAPGVYLHKDVTQSKAEHYMRFVHLPPYSAFWAIEWEVKVFRPAHVRPPRATDQWIQPTQSVRLIALWVCAREAEELETSSPVSLPWTPMKEASPFTCQIVSPVALLPNGFLRKLCGKRIRL